MNLIRPEVKYLLNPKKMRRFILILIGLMASGNVLAQDDLLNILEAETTPQREYIYETFKGNRIINGQSVETQHKGELDFLISHRFGRINSGAYELFGLDQANIRIGLEYGISENLTFGIGRNSFEKTFDAFGKYRILRQQKGLVNMPISLVFFSSVALKTLKDFSQPANDLTIPERLTFTNQILIASKLNRNLSLQLMPTYIHRNTAPAPGLKNEVIAMGSGIRYKVTRRMSVNLEHYYLFNNPEGSEIFHSLAVGLDIETGGHVFQFHLTNSRAMIEKGFIAETRGDWTRGDIHLGFNISRSFQLR